MKAELSARNHEPITGDLVTLGAGAWCEGSPAAGELSTQGIVEYNGVRDRFDQAVGQGWIVVGLNTNPAEALNTKQLEWLRSLDGRTVSVGSDSGCDAMDIDGTYADWLASMNAKFFILRPDFYVAATAGSDGELGVRIDEVFGKLGLR